MIVFFQYDCIKFTNYLNTTCIYHGDRMHSVWSTSKSLPDEGLEGSTTGSWQIFHSSVPYSIFKLMLQSSFIAKKILTVAETNTN